MTEIELRTVQHIGEIYQGGTEHQTSWKKCEKCTIHAFRLRELTDGADWL